MQHSQVREAEVFHYLAILGDSQANTKMYHDNWALKQEADIPMHTRSIELFFKWKTENRVSLICWNLLSYSLMILLEYLIAFCYFQLWISRIHQYKMTFFWVQEIKVGTFLPSFSFLVLWHYRDIMEKWKSSYNCTTFVEFHCFLAGICFVCWLSVATPDFFRETVGTHFEPLRCI